MYEILSQYLTREVVTVLCSLGAIYVGWKSTGKLVGLTKSLVKKTSFAGLASACMVVGGLTFIGSGLDTINTQPDELSKAEIANLIVNNDASDREISLLYELIKNEEKSDISFRDESLTNEDFLKLMNIVNSKEQLQTVIDVIEKKKFRSEKNEEFLTSFKAKNPEMIESSSDLDAIEEKSKMITFIEKSAEIASIGEPSPLRTIMLGAGLALVGAICFACKDPMLRL